ncbi:MAG: peptidase domain protein [Verrucomicrobiaceae bacterium]|nr:peptidase domain protein [Verrucomicrobiaceae bacterium]
MNNFYRTLLCGWLIVTALTARADDLDIPYQQFVLPNGLTLIVHEDHKAPLIAMNMWYHVGSKNEKTGQTGFAHLFEHLMFNGSEHFNDEYFRPFEKAGATDMNGTTNNDRTNYFATFPKPALDMALWMESDRMANLLPALDQAKLDEQRGVVKNEKRQGEDRPFGRVFEQISHNTYPAGHPYSWEVIGSMEDLDAASLEQVHNWFKNYYGPNNAVLVIAGDVEPQQIKQKVEHYFGAIAANPPVQRTEHWIAKRSEERRDVMQDRVPNTRIYLVWNTPAYADRESNQLDLLADILTGDASGLLARQLVQTEKLATNISAYQMAREIGGQFLIAADVAPGVDPAVLEKRLRAELALFQKNGSSKEILARAKTNYRAQFLRAAEKIGGFSGKSDVLASGTVLAKNPAYYRQVLNDVAATTNDQLRAVAQTWLDNGVYVLTVTPYAQYQTNNEKVDRTHVPEAGAAQAPNIPNIERATLDNGLQLVLLRRTGLPLVELQLQFGFGRYVDGLRDAGTTSFALQMLQESNSGMDSATIAEKTRALGATIDNYVTIDSSGLTLSALTENLDASTQLFAQLIEKPGATADALENLKQQTLAQIKREQSDGRALTQRVLPRLLFGDDHPDAVPLSNSGRADVINAMTRENLQQFYRDRFTPAQATLIAAGDLDINSFKTLAQKHFGAWKNADAKIAAPIPTANPIANNAALFFIDLPGGAQATISAATVLPPAQQLDMHALNLANAALGGLFTSRINMNLREDKHWSYGTRSSVIESRGPQLWIATGGVQIDKTGPSLIELRREWQEFSNSKLITNDELEKVREQQVRQLPGAYETNSALLQATAKNLRLQRGDNYLRDDSKNLSALTLAAVQQQSKVLKTDAVFLIIGDKQKILPQLRALNWGPVIELDRDGTAIDAKK